MKTLADISSFLRYELDQITFNYGTVDTELGLAEGTFVRVLDGAGDYSVTELMAVLQRLGFELDIFDIEVLKQMRDGPAGPTAESPVKTQVEISVERIRTQPVPRAAED